ncbi:hypothetical protein D5086_032700 [Populus alba]|uniref:Uncharacterized protein n=1 Tax=Populus alba TaxID=43335 RepID=A0ACC4AET2_POPAL
MSYYVNLKMSHYMQSDPNGITHIKQTASKADRHRCGHAAAGNSPKHPPMMTSTDSSKLQQLIIQVWPTQNDSHKELQVAKRSDAGPIALDDLESAGALVLACKTCTVLSKDLIPTTLSGLAETNPVLMNRKQGRLEVLFSPLKSFKWLWR